eukprot:SAG31_NODE_2382_length_5827_cov_1.421962_6_plen_163_part_00
MKNRVTKKPQQVGLIQPTIWASSPTDVHVLLRSDGGEIYRADSADAGITFGPAVATGMPNNNSGIDVTWLPTDGCCGGLLAMLHNPVAANWGARTPLTLSVSTGESCTCTCTCTCHTSHCNPKDDVLTVLPSVDEFSELQDNGKSFKKAFDVETDATGGEQV